jgi:hypothetical protein
MANPKKHVLMFHVVSAFVRGCNGAEIGDDVAEAFHDRYFKWLDTQKATGKTPQEVWAEYGKDFVGKFMDIGKQAAAGGSVTTESLASALKTVEGASECPYCPDKP